MSSVLVFSCIQVIPDGSGQDFNPRPSAHYFDAQSTEPSSRWFSEIKLCPELEALAKTCCQKKKNRKDFIFNDGIALATRAMIAKIAHVTKEKRQGCKKRTVLVEVTSI